MLADRNTAADTLATRSRQTKVGPCDRDRLGLPQFVAAETLEPRPAGMVKWVRRSLELGDDDSNSQSDGPAHETAWSLHRFFATGIAASRLLQVIGDRLAVGDFRASCGGVGVGGGRGETPRYVRHGRRHRRRFAASSSRSPHQYPATRFANTCRCSRRGRESTRSLVRSRITTTTCCGVSGNNPHSAQAFRQRVADEGAGFRAE